MFQKSSNQQPFYLQKKKLFHQSIRKRQKQIIINKLRKRAQLPTHVQEWLINLPNCISQLIEQIVQKQLKQWQQIIAEEIITKMKDNLRQLFDYQKLTQAEVISLFIFLLNKSNQEQQIYKQYFHFLRQKANTWTYPNKINLFLVFNLMLKKGHSFVLQDAELFHSTLSSNRFFQSQLSFYDLIIRKYSNNHNLLVYLPHQTLIRLSEQIQSHFYNQQQRIKMLQILIQILYASEQQSISRCLKLPKLFSRLQYFIGYNNKNKLLVDRSILLIYNINIDATSKSFVNHNCFKIIGTEMKNHDNLMKIRSLFAQLYFNCILNYPQEDNHSFLKNSISSILENLQYIVQQFIHLKEIKQFIIQLMTSLITSTQEKQGNSIKGQASLLTKLSTIEQCQPLLQKLKRVNI